MTTVTPAAASATRADAAEPGPNRPVVASAAIKALRKSRVPPVRDTILQKNRLRAQRGGPGPNPSCGSTARHKGPPQVPRPPVTRYQLRENTPPDPAAKQQVGRPSVSTYMEPDDLGRSAALHL